MNTNCKIKGIFQVGVASFGCFMWQTESCQRFLTNVLNLNLKEFEGEKSEAQISSISSCNYLNRGMKDLNAYEKNFNNKSYFSYNKQNI